LHVGDDAGQGYDDDEDDSEIEVGGVGGVEVVGDETEEGTGPE